MKEALVVIAVIAVIALLTALVLHALLGGRIRNGSPRVACQGNLYNLGLSCAMYSKDHAVLPADLDMLYPEYAEVKWVFDCPVKGRGLASHPGLEESGGYRYIGTLNAAVDPSVIIMYDKAGNHPNGRNALFAGGDFDWIPEANLAARLAQSLALVKQASWDEYSEERKKEIEAFYTLEQTE